MYIMIGGGGLVGKNIAKELVPLKHDVVVIDSDVKACEEIYAKYGAVAIHGNVTDLGTLLSAGIERCDVAVATMRNDADNLAFSLLAKHHNVPQIIVRMIDPKFEAIYKTAGVTNIARGLEFVINQILINIETPELRGVITMGDIEMSIYNIPENATCTGKTIQQLTSQEGFPKGINIGCVYDDSTNTFLVAKGDTELNAKDRLFIIGSKESIKNALNFIC